eukprot:3809557-Rhodomonas_salina.1
MKRLCPLRLCASLAPSCGSVPVSTTGESRRGVVVCERGSETGRCGGGGRECLRKGGQGKVDSSALVDVRKRERREAWRCQEGRCTTDCVTEAPDPLVEAHRRQRASQDACRSLL